MPTLPPTLMQVDVPSTWTKPAPYCLHGSGFRGAGVMLCFVATGFFDAAAKACSGMTAISSPTTIILMVFPRRLYAVA